MVAETWTLIDIQQQTHTDSLSIAGTDVCAAADNCHVKYELLRGGLRDGLHLLTIDNGALRVAILPERGMGLWKAWAGNTEIGWQSPLNGPVHPKWVPLAEPGGLGWLAGFDELLVRCGLHSNGAPDFDDQGRLLYPLHGRIANLPAHQLAVAIDKQSGEITVRGTVDETCFHFQKLRLESTIRLRPGELKVQVQDEVTNLSGNPGEMQLLYHINFGPPIHSQGAEIVLPVKEMSPRDGVAAADIDNWHRYGPPEVGSIEQVNFFAVHGGPDGQTRAVLKAADAASGVSVHYNVNQLPCFTQWKNTPPEVDGYCTGFEPGTNYPNPRSLEQQQGRVVELAAGETRQFDLALEYHPDAASLTEAEKAVRAIAADRQPTIHRQPGEGWT